MIYIRWAVLTLVVCLLWGQPNCLRAEDAPLNNPEIVYVSRTPISSANVIAQGRAYIYYGKGGAIAVYDKETLTLQGRVSIHLDQNPGEGERAGTQGITGVFYDSDTEKLYVACSNAGLQIYDVSAGHETVPVWQSTYIVHAGAYEDIRARAKDVFVKGDYAYVVYKTLTADGHRTGIQILDIRDALNPALVGECGTPEAFTLGLAGLVEREQSIFVYDGPEGLQAYITDYSNGLAVYNVDDPANPAHEAWGAMNYALDVTVSEGVVYVAVGGYGLWLFNPPENNDISNDNIERLAVCQYNEGETLATSLEVCGDYVYIADNQLGLVIIDASDPARLDTTAVDYQAESLAELVEYYAVDMSGAYCVQVDSNNGESVAYVGNRINGLQKIAVKNRPDNSTAWEVTGVDSRKLTPGPGDVDAFALDRDFGTDKSYAYVVDDDPGGKEGFYVYYARFAADWIDLLYKGFLPTAGEARDVAVSGDYAYVADGSQGLKVIDPGLPETDALGYIKVEEVANPRLAGACPIGAGSAARLKVGEGYVYVASESGGLRVINVADPQNPWEAGCLAGADISDARSVDVSGDYAYVAAGAKGLHVVDVADPANPVLRGTCSLPGMASDVSVVGNAAYVACREFGQGLAEFDGTTWRHHLSVVPRDIDSITVAADIAWLGTNGEGVQLFDIARSAWLRSYTTADGLANDDVEAIAVGSDGRVWLGTAGDGVSVFDGSTFATYTRSDSGLAGNDIETIAIDAGGSADIIWIGTQGNGLSRYDGTWTTYDTSAGLAHNEIEGIAVDSSGDVWVATDGGGVCRFDGNRWVTYDETVSGLPYNQIEAIAVDRFDDIWVGSETQQENAEGITITVGGGVSRYDSDAGTWTNYDTSNSPLGSNRVLTIAVSSAGVHDVVWFGTYGGGVSKCTVVNPDDETTWQWASYNIDNGLPDNYVQDIAVDGSGHAWCGFFYGSGGIYEVDVSDPANPEQIGSYVDADYSDIIAIYAAVSDENPDVDLFWVANGEKGLGYFKNPKAVPLTLLQWYNTTGFVKQVRAYGSFAVMAEGAGGIQVAGVDPNWGEESDDAWQETVPTDLSSGGGSSGCFLRTVFPR